MTTARKTVSIALVLAAGSLTGCGWFGGGGSSKQAAATAEPMEASPVAFEEAFDTSEFNQLNHRVLAEFDHFIVEPSSFKPYGGRGFKRGTSNGLTESFDKYLNREIGARFPVVNRIGPNTARVQVTVTDFRRSPTWQQANPGFDPMAPAMGEAFAEVRYVHSQTGEVMGRFLVEQSQSGFTFNEFATGNPDGVFADFAWQIGEQMSAMGFDSLMQKSQQLQQQASGEGDQPAGSQASVQPGSEQDAD